MKNRTIQFSLNVNRGTARLEMKQLDVLAQLSFLEGSTLFQEVVRVVVRSLRKQGLVPRKDRGLTRIDPFGFLSGATGLPFEPIDVQILAQPKRVITVCMDCNCTGDGGCQCKVVKCPDKPVA